MQCLWGFTSILKAFEKVNYKTYDDAMKMAFLPLKFLANPRELLKSKSKVKSFLYRSGLFCGRIYSIICKCIGTQHSKSRKNKYEISNNLKSPNDVNDLYESLKEKHPNLIHIHQSKNYINWRIHNNPSKKIKTLFVYSNHSLVGYAYIRFGNRVASLIDITFIELEAGFLLMKLILNALNTKAIDLVTYTGNIKNDVNLTVFKLLKSFGFLTIDSPTDFIIQNLNYPDEDILYNIKNWYINGIWHEGI